MTMTKEELIIKTTEWARERGLHKGCYQIQVLKLAEELGELIGAHLKLKKGPSDKWRQVQKDSVGDMAVVMGVIRSILIEGEKMDEEIITLANGTQKNQSPFDDLSEWNTLPLDSSELILQKIINEVGGIPFILYGAKELVIQLYDIWKYLQFYCISERLDIYECWELAYKEVAQRKGKTIGGVFVKDGD